jgi:pyruvate,orthophosphate dikinase
VKSIALSGLYRPGDTLPDSEQDRKNLLGGKGAGLFEMTKLGVPVPKFIVIPTSLCVDFMAGKIGNNGDTTIDDLITQIIEYFDEGGASVPLLSVRSGARVSMPGMMDTILNVGIGCNDCQSYTEQMEQRMLADCQRRFLHMFGATALGIDDKLFEEVIKNARKKANADTDADLNAKQLEEVVSGYINAYNQAEKPVPTDLREQLSACIYAVMNSWSSPRAIEYRNQTGISHDWGTAVVIQRMVFGNMNDDSGSGVLFSRDPQTGEDVLTGEFLPNAQGEDVVAGIRTPLPLKDMATKWTELFGELNATVCSLEDQYGDMLDIEFTVESGTLYFLQVRTGKRSARAAVRIALDMYDGESLTRDKVFDRVNRDQVRLLTQPVIDAKFKIEPAGVGLPACSGVVTGFASFTPEDAVARKAKGEDVILIRHETSPDDIAGMFAAIGILTATGGSTSHAAVVARGMDKTCITGCQQLEVSKSSATLNSMVIGTATKVTLDGATGRIWLDCDVPVSDPKDDKDLADLTAFVFGGKCKFQYFPGNTGSVYGLSQFMETLPAPVGDGVVEVMVDQGVLETDLVLAMSGAITPAFMYENLIKWLTEHDRKATLYTPQALHLPSNDRVQLVTAEANIKGMMTRPVSRHQVISVFGDEDTLNSLIAPATINEKFNLFHCERYDLLAAFK